MRTVTHLTKPVALVASTAALTALTLPVLLAPASGAGTRVGATAIVESPRGPVLMARISGATKSVRVVFTCKGGTPVPVHTLRGQSSDTAVARIVGADAHRVSSCRARAGASQRSIPRLPAGSRAAGGRLVGVLGAALPLPGDVARVNVALSAPGTITIRTAAGRTLLKTGRHLAGLYRLLVRKAPRATTLVVRSGGHLDRIVVGTSPAAAPLTGSGESLTAPGAPAPAPATPTAPPAPPPPPPPPPPGIPVSHVTLACPGSVPVAGTLVVTGTLTPPVAGASISVTFALSGKPPVFQGVQTDAAGNFTAQASDPNGIGTWSIQAVFAGDAGLQGSQATCATKTP